MTTDATDPSQIRFSKDDINENMFTKKMLWDAVLRQEKEIHNLKQENEKLKTKIAAFCKECVGECSMCELDDIYCSKTNEE